MERNQGDKQGQGREHKHFTVTEVDPQERGQHSQPKSKPFRNKSSYVCLTRTPPLTCKYSLLINQNTLLTFLNLKTISIYF